MMQASARGLAKLAAYMANKGKLGNKVLLSENAWDELHADYKTEILYGFNDTSTFSKAGVNKYGTELTKEEDREFGAFTNGKLINKTNSGREGFIGWAGLGGSVF